MSIADKITSMTTHLEQDYVSIEALTGTITEDKNIENIAPILDNLWEELPHTTGTGESLSLATKSGKMKVNLLGNTSQDSTTGKQLFNYASTNYVENQAITITGTGENFTISAPSQYGVRAIYLSEIDFSTLYVYMTSSYVTYSVAFYSTNSDSYNSWSDFYNDRTSISWLEGQTGTVDLSNYQGKYLWVLLRGSYTLSDYTSVNYKNFILSKESVSSYEPYTGKIPAPNPSYPEDVHIVSGDNTITTTGKNLFDITKAVKGGLNASGGYISGGVYSYEVSGNSVAITTTTSYRGIVSDYIEVEPNTKYTISYEHSSDSYTYGTIWKWYDENKNYISNADTSPANAKYIRFSIVISETGSFTLSNIQLEKGNTATTFTPYTSTSYPVNLPVENIISGLKSNHNNFVSYYFVNSKIEKTMTYSFIPTTSITGCKLYLLSDNMSTLDLGSYDLVANQRNTITFTLTDTEYSNIKSSTNGNLQIYKSGAFSGVTFSEVQLEKGSSASTYWAYGTTPIELCKISTYQDRFFKNIPNTPNYNNTLQDNEWYLEKKIGKYTMTGTETLSNTLARTNTYRFTYSIDDKLPNSTTVLKYFASNRGNGLPDAYWTTDAVGICEIKNQTMPLIVFSLPINEVYDVDTAKTWLSTHNTDVYYALASPTYTPITGTLKDELEAVWRANSYKGQTNISQVNNDLPFNLDITALEDISEA